MPENIEHRAPKKKLDPAGRCLGVEHRVQLPIGGVGPFWALIGGEEVSVEIDIVLVDPPNKREAIRVHGVNQQQSNALGKFTSSAERFQEGYLHG